MASCLFIQQIKGMFSPERHWRQVSDVLKSEVEDRNKQCIYQASTLRFSDACNATGSTHTIVY